MVSAGDPGEVLMFPDREAIKSEAAAWLVRIDSGNMTSQEVEELKEWANRSAYHKDLISKLASEWDQMAVLEDLAEVFPLSDLDGIIRKASSSGLSASMSQWISASGSGWRLAGAAATVALALFVGLTMFTTRQTIVRPTELATIVGEQSQHTLSDGTRVTLNTNTRIQIDFTDKQRTVRLLQGEASFQVSKDPDKPFVVFAGSGMAEAIGTAFNVRLESNAVDVIVTEGIVRVVANTALGLLESKPSKTGGQPDIPGSGGQEAYEPPETPNVNQVFLSKGQSALFDHVVRKVDTEVPQEVITKKLAWQRGSIVFQGETLEQALEEISRYTNKKVIIVDESIAEIRVGGHFKTDDIEGLFVSLSTAFGIDVREGADDNTILLTSRDQ